MSKIVSKNMIAEDVKFSVKDTDFMLKLIMRSEFTGGEVETAYRVIQKLSELHRRHLES